MTEANYFIHLDWKPFNVDVNAVNAWIKANTYSNFCGSSGQDTLMLCFTSEPSERDKALIQKYWDEMAEESPEATSYRSAKERLEAAAAEKAANKASAKAKLLALGLSEEEIAALSG